MAMSLAECFILKGPNSDSIVLRRIKLYLKTTYAILVCQLTKMIQTGTSSIPPPSVPVLPATLES
jgi:hypothetical protein